MDAPEIHILSVGTALPGPPVDNATLARQLGTHQQFEQWVDTFIGTRTRHLSVDLETGEVNHSLADLGTTAGGRALAAAGLEASDIDVIVMGTATPDALMPATVNLIADRLGIDGIPTYQLQSGCAGAVQALDVGREMLLTGRHTTALVIGGDVCAKHLDIDMDVSSMAPAQLVNVVLFGDGAGAAVLSTRPTPGSVTIKAVLNRLTGLGRAPGQVIEWFGLADRASDRPAGMEDYKAIEESVPVMAGEILKELLDTLGWQQADLDFLLPPQLSGRMTKRIVERLAVADAQEVSCVQDTGNNGNALVFFQLERALERMGPGDRAIAVAVESSKWIKAGFALEKV
ncbi:3-oxoacyl-ACP synthase III family protein [Streptomyces sp. NRRL F-525]|uniref:3-oxoacyl-ACP synthase III family protein n=1 Tax=Streptomyces sp. NRRL F-525 TaxID=1463861 RepID=UPI0005251BBC|nr:3-oxoacyl-ACP synthase III family protein [Streptomyces sp. NRRL F-525]